MEVKKSLPLAAALLALGISGPAAALASDGGDGGDHAGTSVGATVTAPVDQSGEDQQSGEQGDVENTDLASQVEQEDATDQSSDAPGEDDNPTAGDQQSGAQVDQQNSDLANEVEQEDGAGNTSGDVNQENEVDDSND